MGNHDEIHQRRHNGDQITIQVISEWRGQARSNFFLKIANSSMATVINTYRRTDEDYRHETILMDSPVF